MGDRRHRRPGPDGGRAHPCRHKARLVPRAACTWIGAPPDRIFALINDFKHGGEPLLGAFNWLDLTPEGRNETSVMGWVRLHDEYGKE